MRCYLGRDGSDIGWDFIRLALASVADLAIVPLQDVLGLGSEARMNTPGQRRRQLGLALHAGHADDPSWSNGCAG